MKAKGWFSGWSSIIRRARSLSVSVLVQCSDLVKAGHSSIDAATRTRCETAREDIVCARMEDGQRSPGSLAPVAGLCFFNNHAALSILPAPQLDLIQPMPNLHYR